MATPPDDSPTAHPLEPVLRDAEAELRRRLGEACEAESRGISSESTAEIRRLEDRLLAAAVAAEHTIALRRHIDQHPSAPVGDAKSDREREATVSAESTSEQSSRVREFKDARGQGWRAWPVTPGSARPGRTAERYLGEFHKGWICFEALDSSARRRLPLQPPRWLELADSELAQLLDEAISAPERKARPTNPGTSAHGDSVS